MSENPGPNPQDAPEGVNESDVDEVRDAEATDDEVARSAPTEGTDQDPGSFLNR